MCPYASSPKYYRAFMSALSNMKKTVVCFMVLGCLAAANAAITNYFNFETAPVQPVALGPDGRTLAVCNLPDNRVEFFDVSNGVPVATGSVAVGLDPVTARFASSNELWVVNHISSTISIVDVAAKRVVATLETPAGPSDLVFAGNPRRAWVTCSRTNAVFVIDPATRAAVTNIAIDGERPRNMAVSPDGSKVYVAIFESGNGTTMMGTRMSHRAQERQRSLDGRQQRRLDRMGLGY
jgi:DNA-binding beta-propeller fold protein YncE